MRVALSIVVCTRDRYPFLRKAIASIEGQTLDAERFELIVVDNSADRAAQVEFMDGLVVDCRCDYAIEERPGLSRARNIGTALSNGDIVAFLDDDAIASPRWAETILDRFAARPTIGVLGGPVEPIWLAARPSWMPPWLDAFLSVLDHGPEPRPLGAREWLVGANLAVRKSVLLAAGGFSESLGRLGPTLLSNEDLALTRRIVDTGLEAFYDPRMRVSHHIHPERLTQPWLRRRIAWQAVSDIMASLDYRDDRMDGLPLDFPTLFAEQPDADHFSAQLESIRRLMTQLLDAPPLLRRDDDE